MNQLTGPTVVKRKQRYIPNGANHKTHLETQARKRRFLSLVRGEDGMPLSIRAACDAIGMTRSTYMRWRETDPEFETSYQEVLEDGTDLVEDEAHRRAIKGIDDPVYYMGEIVGHKTVYSDGLLTTILKARRPERYRGDSTNVQVAVINDPTDRDLAKAMSLMVEEAKNKQVSE